MINIEQIESALQVINSDDRDTWLKIGMAINSEIGDSGFYLWDKWSQSAENYDQRDSESVWKSFTPGGGVNIGSLFHLAKQNGWSGAGLNTLSQAEVAQQKADLEAKNKLAVAQKAKKQQQTAGIAQQLWRTGNSTPSKYLKRKQVEQVGTVKTLSIGEVEKTIGYRPKTSNKKHADNPYLEGQLTLVPVVVDGKISTIEMIDDKGRKSALKDGAKSGGYWAAQKMPEGNGSGQTFLVGEGVATVLSCRQATGGFAIAALSCHNLILVARQIKERYTDSNVVILSDLGNGQKAATDAAQAINGLLAVPEFPDGVTGSDFNDLAVAVGLDEVRRQIEAAAEPKQKTLSTLKTLQTTDNEKQWEEPLLFGEVHTPEIPASILPSWLGEYAGAVAATTQTPEGMAVMLALSTAATCLQKRFAISPYGGDYREPINLWTVTALPPASRKTAVIEALTEPLLVWEREQAEQMADEIRQVKTKREVSLARIAKLTKQAANEDDTQQRQVILYDIVEVEKDMPEEIRPPRLWTGDVTPERLQGLLVDHGERMALLSDEAGIFEIMAGLYSDGKVNLDVFLQAHAGKSVRVDRTSRAAHLEAPALTFGLAVQPAVIADLSQGSKKKFRGNGSLARFLYCLPKNNIGKRNVRNHYSIPATIKAEYHAGMVGLLKIDPELDQDGREYPRQLTLNAEALECWLAFSEFIESKQGVNGEYESIQDWTGKLPGAALRIAGIVHVVEYGLSTMKVNQSTMVKALDLAALLIEHAKAAFDLMAADQITDDAKAILQWITGNELDQFTRTDVRKALKGRWTKAERLNKALEELQNRDIIGDCFKGETTGRYAMTYPVNPSLFGEVAA